MRLRSIALAVSLVSSMSVAVPATAQQNVIVRPEVVAEYPAGTFLENLDELGNGDVVFTSYFAKTIEILERKTGKARTFAQLSSHPVAILALGDGFIVSAHGQPFTSGPKFVETQRLLILDKNGNETATIPAAEARFLNGLVRHRQSRVLVADSIAATIWEVDLRTRKIVPWLKDEALSQDPAVKEFKPGANGLKRRGTTLYVSNSSRGTLSSIKIDASGRGGKPQLVAKVGPIDDFALVEGGDVIFATHSDTLRRLRPDGSISDLISKGCDGCTAVAVTGASKRQLLVLTTGGLAEGRKEPARVLRLPLR